MSTGAGESGVFRYSASSLLQALATLVREILQHSAPGRLRHLVQLHLSRDCNRPALAREAARAALTGHEVKIHTASQNTPILTVSIGAAENGKRPRRRGSSLARSNAKRPLSAAHQWLPGLEPDPSSQASA